MATPLFTMPTLGYNGRFANQLFQYAFLRLCARRRDAAIQTFPWAGQQLFGFRDPLVDVVAPIVVDGEAAPDPDRYLHRGDPLGDVVEFRGFFQYDTRHYRPYRDFIRQLFVLEPMMKALCDEVVTRLRAGGRPLVALHLRRGDYGHAQFFRAPAKWYADWLQGRAEPRDPVVYLCSEAPGALAGHFPGQRIFHAGLLPGLSPKLAFILDFYVLTQADEVAVSNSSFSFMAAMLNERAGAFVRPTLEERQLVAFDPWDAPVVLPRQLVPGEQAELDACDRNLAPIAGHKGPHAPSMAHRPPSVAFGPFCSSA
jgi:hypothetical protein